MKKPWYESWKCGRRRCIDPGHKSYARYGGRGIEFKLTQDEVQRIWERDQAHLMERPRLDRIDVDGDYTFLNCRFIPESENLKYRDQKPEPAEWVD